MEDKELKVEYKIYDFLNELKIKNPEIYKKAKVILKYLYKTLNKDSFHQTVADYITTTKKESSRDIEYLFQKLFEKYVNSEKTILDNLINMCQNDQTIFIYLYHQMEPVLEMIDEGLYYDYAPYNYVFNLYTIFKRYELHPDDYETLYLITNEISNLFISSSLYFYKFYGLPSPLPFEEKKEIIDLILSNNNLKDRNKLRVLLKDFLDDINYEPGINLLSGYRKVINALNALYQKEIELTEEGFLVTPETISKIEDEILSSIVQKDIKVNGSTNNTYYVDKINYFVPISLVGNRYEYLKNKLDEVEDSEAIKKDILAHVKEFNFEFFHHLDLTTPSDSFIACMDNVLDSDTYLEVKNKLDYLIKLGSRNYTSITLPDVIAQLNSTRRKEAIDGITMEWIEPDTMNKVEKPPKIIDRMIILHQKVDDAPPQSFYYELCARSNHQEVTLENCSREIINKIENTRKNRQELERQKQEEMELLNQTNQRVKQKTIGVGSIFSKKKQ